MASSLSDNHLQTTYKAQITTPPNAEDMATVILNQGFKGLARFNAYFRAIVCKENVQEVIDFWKKSQESIGSELSGEEIVNAMRNAPGVAGEMKEVAKILGQPDSCDVPVSALPSPDIVASITKSSKTKA